MSVGALLGEYDPAPFRVLQGDASSPYIIVCDHAGRSVPRALGSLGLSEADLERHIAWDLGAAALARRLGAELGAWVILQEYSRLVIDCNRPLDSPDSIVQQSEDTVVPGNLGLSTLQVEARAQCIFGPYHARISRELNERAARGQLSIVIFLHTFTPTFRGVSRPWHAGVLHHQDTRLAAQLLRALQAEAGLVVGDNQPYAASARTDYGLVEHAERRGLLHVELEVRQDLLADAEGQEAWALRLARHLRAAPAASN